MPGLLESLSDEAVATLISTGRKRRFSRGQVVCRQGDHAGAMHLVLSGRGTVAVDVRSGALVTLAVLVPGEVFGEAAVLGASASYPATLTAAEALETLAIEPQGFRELQSRQPAVARAVLTLLAGRLQTVTDYLVEALHEPAETRVLRRLVSLASLYGDGSPGTAVPLNQVDLASIAGVARATANRALRREAVAGTLKLGRGRITIVDPARLAARAEQNAARPAAPVGISTSETGEERRIVTVLCIELSRQETGMKDPEDLRRVQDSQSVRIRTVIEHHGGRLEVSWGGRLMAVFGAPALGDDALNAVRAALELLAEDPLAIRIGVETGEASVRAAGEGSRVIGAVIDAAAKLGEASPAGGVFVGEETYRATRRTVRYSPASGGWLAEAIASARALRAPLVGREREIQLLKSVWNGVVTEGRPWLVTLLGPPGIGKTRLGLEISDRVERDGGSVLRGRSLPYAAGTGYGPFVEQVKLAAGITDTDSETEVLAKLQACVARAVSEDEVEGIAHDLSLILGAGPAGPSDRQSLFMSARRLVAGMGRSRPTVLVFEDAHWSDLTMLDLIESFGSRMTDSKVLILVLARPELLDRKPTWAGGLPNSTTVELDVLSPDGGARLAAQLLPSRSHKASLRKRLVELAGGNPLFLEELAAAAGEVPTRGLDQLPTTLITTISARLDALLPPARAALLDAAVVGKRFWRGALQQMAGHSDLDDLLDLLEAKGFIRREPISSLPSDREYLFKHIFIREVAYDTIPHSERQQRHQRVARFLERVAGDRVGEQASLLAHHWRMAGQQERALRYLIEAAERASGGAAHREAAGLLTEAIQLAEVLGDTERVADLRARRGIQNARIGEWAPARPDLEAAIAALPANQLERRIKLLDELAMVCHWLMDGKAMRRHANEARRLAEEAGRKDLIAAATGILGWADSAAGDIDSAMRNLDIALANPKGIPAELLGPTAELSILALYWRGKPQDSVKRGLEALDIARAAKDTNTTIRTLGNLILAYSSTGRFRDAADSFTEARRFGEEFGTGPFLARAIAMYGGVQLELGEYAAAEALAEEAARLARHHKFSLPVISTGIDLMFNFARRGEPERARALVAGVEESVRAAQGAHGWLWRLRLATAIAEIALAQHRWTDARQAADDALAKAKASGRYKYEVIATSILARVAAEDGKLDLATSLAMSGLARAREAGDPLISLKALSCLSEIEDDAGIRAELTALRSRIASSN